MTERFWDKGPFWRWAIPALLVVVGVIVFLPVPEQVLRENRIALAPVETTATVVDVEWSGYQSHRKGLPGLYTPTVRFEANGRVVTQELDGVFDPYAYRSGRAVPVTYCELSPDVVVATAGRYTFLIALSVGAALFLLGILGVGRRLVLWINSS